MAYIRLKDITSHHKEMIDRISERGFLDIGCGPGRYIRGIRKFVTDCPCVGIDASQDIIDYNQLNNCDKHVSYLRDDLLATTVSSKYGLVMCNGVAHHTTYKPEAFIPVHADLVADDGFYFLFMYGDDGIELKTWDILQAIVREVPVELAYNTLQPLLNPLRLQGQLDHMYGAFYRSRPEYIRALLQNHFSSVHAVEGVPGLDITTSTMKHLSNDAFERRFGTGNIRFICKK
jgi:SAM-dependent methyltransferase